MRPSCSGSHGVVGRRDAAQVTFVNDSPLMVTAWAVNAVVTRADGATVTLPSSRVDAIGALATLRIGRNAPHWLKR